MSWDPVLLRKFSTTGHFRLLNQLRTELRAQPLQRQAPSAEESGRPRTGALVRAVELRPQQPASHGRQRRQPALAPVPTAAAAEAAAASQAGSFRDRLNAIDMR